VNRWERTKRYLVLSSAVALWLNAPLVVMADNAAVTIASPAVNNATKPLSPL